MRKLHFLFLTLGALACFTAYVIFSSTDPQSIPFKLSLLLYACIVITLICLMMVARISLHPWLRKSVLEPLPTLSVLRQAVIFAGVSVSMLLLQSLRSLNWLDAVLITLSAVLFEMFFRVRIPVTQQKQVI